MDPQVLEDAKAVDEAFAAGQDIKPLCGLAFAVKDNIDVLGYPTAAGTPALEGADRSSPWSMQWICDFAAPDSKFWVSQEASTTSEGVLLL